MLLPAGSRRELWQRHLCTQTIALVSSPHTVREPISAGRAELACSFTGEALHVKLDGSFPGLVTRKCADHVLVEDPWGSAPRAHIIEFTRKIKLDDWKHIKEQFYGALLRLLAVGSLCNLPLASVTCYAAYRVAQVPLDPIIIRTLPSSDLEAARQWHEQLPLTLGGIDGARLSFRRVDLDAEGRGALSLSQPVS